MGVKAVVGVKIHPRVEPEFQVIFHFWAAPDLRRHWNFHVAPVYQRLGVVALHGAVRGIGMAVFQTGVDKAGIGQRQTDIAGKAILGAVPSGSLPIADFHRTTIVIILELEIHHPGNGVAAVLRRRAIAQHLNLFEGNGGYGGNVRPLGTIGDA